MRAVPSSAPRRRLLPPRAPSIGAVAATAVVLAGCGTTDDARRDGATAAVPTERVHASCRRLGDPATYRAVGLRRLARPGSNARDFVKLVRASAMSAAGRRRLVVLSLGDGDRDRDSGERLPATVDQEDVAVLISPPTPGEPVLGEAALRRAEANQRATVEGAGRAAGFPLRYRSTLRSGLLRATITAGPLDVVEHSNTFVSRCGVVRLHGWPRSTDATTRLARSIVRR